MTPSDAIACLNEPVQPAALERHWTESLASDDGRTPAFLMPAAVTRNRRKSGLPAEAEAVLQEAARRIAAHPVLRLLARHADRLLYEHDDFSSFGAWPSFEPTLGEHAPVFYLLILLAAAPRIRATHRRLGIPADVTRATCDRLDSVARFRVTHNGQWGAARQFLYWMRHYTAGRLFRIGRMEYMPAAYNGRVVAFRHARTGAVAALAPDGTRFTREGYVHAAPAPDDPGGWTASLREEPDAVRGCYVSPRGMALRREVTLPRAAWRPVLRKDDWTLDMHIPPGGGMTLEACADSMRRAASFFARHVPDRPAGSITCNSWIFNTQLDGIFPPEANLVLYQRELYLYPVPSTGQDGLVFIFGRADVDPATAPRDTSLRRGILDFLAAGHRWRGGGMFFLTEDLPRFGTHVYRTGEPGCLAALDGTP